MDPACWKESLKTIKVSSSQSFFAINSLTHTVASNKVAYVHCSGSSIE